MAFPIKTAISHDRIINVNKFFKLTKDNEVRKLIKGDEGRCAGFTQMWLQAWLSLGTEGERQFDERLALIQPASFEAYFAAMSKQYQELNERIAKPRAVLHEAVNKIRKELRNLHELLKKELDPTQNELLHKEITASEAQLKEAIAERNLQEAKLEEDVGITPEMRKIVLDVPAFYENLTLYQEPDRFTEEVFGTSLQQDSVAKFIASKTLDEQGGITNVETKYLPALDIQSYFEKLYKVVTSEKLKNVRIGFTVGDGKHRIGVRYDAEAKKWWLIDSNDLPPKSFSTEALVKELSTALDTREELRIRHFTLHQHAEQVTEEIFYHNIKVSYGLSENAAFLTKKDDKGQTMLHRAAAENNINIKHLLIDGINLDQTDQDGNTAAHIAARQGNNAMLALLVDTKFIDLNKPNREGRTVIDYLL